MKITMNGTKTADIMPSQKVLNEIAAVAERMGGGIYTPAGEICAEIVIDSKFMYVTTTLRFPVNAPSECTFQSDRQEAGTP
jgi:hypothetical protein